MLPEPAAIEALLRKSAEEFGFDVIQVRVDARRHVRMWVDLEPDGINVADTTRLSRGLNEVIEAEGLDPGTFQFEVQSPGLDRILAREKDFVRFAGQEIKVRLHRKRSDRANFRGQLVGVREGRVVVAVDGQEISFELGEIRESRLVPQLPWGNKSKSDSGNHKRTRSGRQRKQKKRKGKKNG